MAFKFNPFTGTFDTVNVQGPGSSSNWQAPVANRGSLPLSGNAVGDVRVAMDTATAYIWTGSVWQAVSGDIRTEKVTLSGTDITNKYITLSATPLTPALARFIVIGGIEQQYGLDFSVSGNQLTWASLALDGVLETGDNIIAIYDI
jgi:hypothetical protein